MWWFFDFALLIISNILCNKGALMNSFSRQLVESGKNWILETYIVAFLWWVVASSVKACCLPSESSIVAWVDWPLRVLIWDKTGKNLSVKTEMLYLFKNICTRNGDFRSKKQLNTLFIISYSMVNQQKCNNLWRRGSRDIKITTFYDKSSFF